MEEDIAHFYFRQLVNGVDFLHSRGVAHRDIKPENLLLDENGNLKIADFGLAALFRLPTGKRRQCHTSCGSPPYVAPEVVAAAYDPDQADVWSCGVVLFVLLCGQTPWDEPTNQDPEFARFARCSEDTRRLRRRAPWNAIPLEALSLLRCLLKVDTAVRFEVADVRLHPWFTRANPFLTEGGADLCNDPNGLATRMLMNLQIDMSDASFSATQQSISNQVPSTMPAALDVAVSSSLPSMAHVSASQQVQPDKLSRKDQAFLTALTQDPVLLQFQTQGAAAAGAVSLSQKPGGVNFKDMFYNKVFTRFYSLMPLQSIVPIIGTAFHQLGIDVRVSRDPMAYANSDTVNLPFMALDRRRILLRGVVQCSVVEKSSQFVEVSFVRSVGDQVEWRHLFKKIVLLCRDSVYIGETI